MKTALDDTTKGIIKSLTDTAAGAGLAKSLADVVKKIDEGINGGPKVAAITADEYNAVKTAVDKITTAIDDTLEAGGLTELDTANLKTLKTAVENVGKTFGAIGEIKPDNTNFKVEIADLAKAKEAMASLDKDLTEASVFAQNSSTASKNQAENIGEMRGQLQAFALDPDANKLNSMSFTGYLETVDAALSNISDQRAKLGASQNRLEYTIKIIMLQVF